MRELTAEELAELKRHLYRLNHGPSHSTFREESELYILRHAPAIIAAAERTAAAEEALGKVRAILPDSMLSSAMSAAVVRGREMVCGELPITFDKLRKLREALEAK